MLNFNLVPHRMEKIQSLLTRKHVRSSKNTCFSAPTELCIALKVPHFVDFEKKREDYFIEIKKERNFNKTATLCAWRYHNILPFSDHPGIIRSVSAGFVVVPSPTTWEVRV